MTKKIIAISSIDGAGGRIYAARLLYTMAHKFGLEYTLIEAPFYNGALKYGLDIQYSSLEQTQNNYVEIRTLFVYSPYLLTSLSSPQDINLLELARKNEKIKNAIEDADAILLLEPVEFGTFSFPLIREKYPDKKIIVLAQGHPTHRLFTNIFSQLLEQKYSYDRYKIFREGIQDAAEARILPILGVFRQYKFQASHPEFLYQFGQYTVPLYNPRILSSIIRGGIEIEANGTAFSDKIIYISNFRKELSIKYFQQLFKRVKDSFLTPQLKKISLDEILSDIDTKSDILYDGTIQHTEWYIKSNDIIEEKKEKVIRQFESIKRRLGIDYLFFWNGRTSIEKGIIDYLKTLKYLQENYGKKVAVITSGKITSGAQQLAYSLNIPIITYIPKSKKRFTDTAILAIYRAIRDLGEVFYAPIIAEDFGLHILEAMGEKLPTVTWNWQAPSEFACNNGAYCVKPFEHKEAANVIYEILKKGADSSRINRGFQFAQQQSLNNVAEKFYRTLS